MNELIVTVFYVGDGDCILLRFPDGTLGLVDSNRTSWTPSCPAIPAIQQAGGRLDFVCLTHPHQDHYRGLFEVLSTAGITVREFWHTLTDVHDVIRYFNKGYGGGPLDALSKRFYEGANREFVELMNCVYADEEASKLIIRSLSEQKGLDSRGGVEILCLAPFDRDRTAFVKRLLAALNQGRRVAACTSNDVSAVLILRFGNAVVLLCGDAPARVLKKVVADAATRKGADWMRSHVVKVSHHGASDSQYDGLWDDLRTGLEEVAVISAGSSAHPSSETLDALRESKRKVFKTGLGGPTFPKGSVQPTGFHPTTQSLLDYFSQSSDANVPCCGDVTVAIRADGSVTVASQRVPKCGYCG